MVKLPSEHLISGLVLVVEPCEIVAKMNYSVFKVEDTRKTVLQKGRILEHQWISLTKKEEPEAEESQSLHHSLGIEISGLKAQYLEI